MESTLIRMLSKLEKGRTYTVKFDGNTYECVAYELEGVICIGNATLMGMNGGNGEPFLIGPAESAGPR